ncbi:MAG: wax ester/triacylglycerol synthase family O-acyltransferase [Dehalococcoidia bacterium]
MTKQLNRRLTSMDAAFLYVEKPSQPMHIGGVMIYEGHVSRDEVRKLLSERIHLIPRYRQKVVFAPFGLAHPTWEDDRDFNLDNHIEELTMPAPGDDSVLSEFGGRLHAQMLDRNHPLWKMYLIQGRQDGNTACLAVVHHTMVDGVSGVDLQMVTHDLTPNAAPPDAPPEAWQPEAPADPMSRLQDAVREQLVDAARTFTDQAFQFMRPTEVRERTRRLMGAVTSAMPSMMRQAPRTPFNGRVSDQRTFAWAEFEFADVRFIRSVLGGTVNDVVLAVLSGGLGRYMRAHGYKTEGVELRAMCPVSMRREDERGALGNLVSLMIAPLFVGILDPVERLEAERSAMERLKGSDQAGGFYQLTEMANGVPPMWQAILGQFDVPQTLINTVSTNVPGPQIPLYMAGKKLLSWLPLGPLAGNVGLFNAILSYNQKITIGPTTDPKLMPDIWFYIDCLKESFAEVKAAAESVAAGTAAPTSVASLVETVASKPVRARPARASATPKRKTATRRKARATNGRRAGAAKKATATAAASAEKPAASTAKAATKRARPKAAAKKSKPAATKRNGRASATGTMTASRRNGARAAASGNGTPAPSAASAPAPSESPVAASAPEAVETPTPETVEIPAVMAEERVEATV